MKNVLVDAEIPELPNHYRGKVRDNFDLNDGRRVLITTDRLSAFDRPICAVPEKGHVLTKIAQFWFSATTDICANHCLFWPDPNVLVATKLTILPIEVVVRDYLAGTTATSLLTMYKFGTVQNYGLTLPTGLRDNELLPETIVTPTTKSDEHDSPISPAELIKRGMMTASQWEQVEAYALALFRRGRKMASSGGLILADTKYEFGVDDQGRIILADEIHTPDSSRFWYAATYHEAFQHGEAPPSFDKDMIRRWITEQCNPYTDPLPAIPADLIGETTEVYIEAYQRLVGLSFQRNISEEPILSRIRRNLQRVAILP